MRIGTVALAASRPPTAALAAPGAGQTVDAAAHLAVDLAVDVAGALRSLTGRWARTLARDLATMLRTRGPVLVALLVRHRPWSGAAPLPAVVGARPSDAAADPLGHLSRIPAQRLAEEPAGRGASLDVQRGSRVEALDQVELALPADPTAPGLARALLHEVTRSWGLDDDLHEDAAMVVTELVANAVDHARTPSTLTLELDGGGLRIAVRDARPGRSLRALPVDPTAPRGRGLQMIEALATSWGVRQDLGGKTVWAVLPRR
jgi:anti-sigma regulatory factor (Ser/Thr protein kinase)